MDWEAWLERNNSLFFIYSYLESILYKYSPSNLEFDNPSSSS